VWSPAEIRKVALVVEGDGPVFQFTDKFGFVFIALIAKEFHGFFLAHLISGIYLFLRNKLLHLLLDLWQVSVRNNYTIARIHIVVETIFDGRPDAKFCARIE